MNQTSSVRGATREKLARVGRSVAALVVGGVMLVTTCAAAEIPPGPTTPPAAPASSAAYAEASPTQNKVLAKSVNAVPSAATTQALRASQKATVEQRKTEATYNIIAGLDGEIFPVFANYASLRPARQRDFGTIAVRIANSTDQPLRNRVAVQIPGWSDQEIQTVELRAGESKTYLFAPTFLPRLYANKEIVAATALVNAIDMGGHVVFSETASVRLRSVDDIYWGQDFRYARFIASWVTPHDATVESVLSQAKEFMPRRRLPGYEANLPIALVEKSTTQQVKAIYRALQERGVSYVKSSMTFGANQEISERVRMPGESLSNLSANCIDGVVMYASLFENLGLQSSVILVPGHAYVSVRLSPKTDDYLLLETSLTGRATFEAAVQAAEAGMAKTAPAEVIRVAVNDARVNGIYPMPGNARVTDVTTPTQISRNSHR